MRDTTAALIVIDVQNDFCPGGALAVPEGDQIIPGINALMAEFAAVILTQDWHPADHLSFASQHRGRAPMELTQMPYGPQVLWPDHCVQASRGAEFHPALNTTRADLILRKGFRRQIDSYSAFFENDRVTPTGLEGYLKTRGITTLTLVGLATDFCVHFCVDFCMDLSPKRQAKNKVNFAWIPFGLHSWPPKKNPHEIHLEIQSEIQQDAPGPSYRFPNQIRSAMLAP